jgi:hypothetical protein
MSKIVKHYAMYITPLIIGGHVYVFGEQWFKKKSFVFDPFISFCLFVLVIVTFAVFQIIPHRRWAAWAGMTHAEFLVESQRTQKVIEWGYKREKGKSFNTGLYPSETETEVEEIKSSYRGKRSKI